jgi:hypothetical protein
MEIWLRTNPRPFLAALIAPFILTAMGAVWLWWGMSNSVSLWFMAAGPIFILGGFLLASALVWRSTQPVLAQKSDRLLLFMEGAEPIAIPLDVVECFFTGQGDALLKDRQGKEREASAIIVRLAESAKEWHHRDVAPQYAHWCEGYITLRGTWCEPIGPDLLRQLNKRLVESQKAQKAKLS